MACVPHYDGSDNDYRGNVFPYDYRGGISGRNAASYRAVVHSMQLSSLTGIAFVSKDYRVPRKFWDRLFNRREVIGEIRVEQAFPLVEIGDQIMPVIDEADFNRQ